LLALVHELAELWISAYDHRPQDDIRAVMEGRYGSANSNGRQTDPERRRIDNGRGTDATKRTKDPQPQKVEAAKHEERG